MKRLILTVLLATLTMASCTATPVRSPSPSITGLPQPGMMEELYLDLASYAYEVHRWGGGMGSGWALNEDTLITAWHVVVNLPENGAMVTKGDKVWAITAINRLPGVDAAVVSVSGPPLKVARLGPAAVLGDTLFLCGSPHDTEEPVVTRGYMAGTYLTFDMIADGSALPGMSGGPVFNVNRQVIGMVVATTSGPGRSLALYITISEIIHALENLSRDRQEMLIRAEEAKELSALDDGIRRFREQNAEQPMSKWPAARVLLVTAAEALVKGIEEASRGLIEGRGLRGALGWGPIILYLEPEVLAFATLSAVLDGVASSKVGGTSPTGTIATNMMRSLIGGRVMLETHFTILKRDAPRLKAVMERKIKKWDARTLRKAMTRINGDFAKVWKTEQRHRVGEKLLSLVHEHCGLLEVYTIWEKGKPRRMVRLLPEAAATMAALNEHLEVMSPLYKPMLCPPCPWASGERGGYLLLSRYHTFVKEAYHAGSG